MDRGDINTWRAAPGVLIDSQHLPRHPRQPPPTPRVESYRASRYAADGITLAGPVLVQRCKECGVATYEGVKRD